MTENQIKYLSLQESRRHNLATEGVSWETLDESKRANRVKEAETERSNRTRETETERHNRYSEGIDTFKALTGGFKDVTSGFKQLGSGIGDLAKFFVT